MIIDLSTSALDNEDILLANTFAYLDSGFANAEFREMDLRRWDAEMSTDCFGELRMRGAGKNYYVSDHAGGRAAVPRRSLVMSRMTWV